MPKIKVKNIPGTTRKRICNSVTCSKCPLLAKYYRCLRLDNSATECVVELSEKDFPTNREWLESLSDDDLAAFYTQGLLIERYSPFPINIHQTIGSFTSSQQGIKEWLSKPCLYLMEEER